MRLSELISSLELWVYPTVGLVAFVAVFAAIAVRTLRQPKDTAQAHGRLPLEDGTTGSGGQQ